MEKKQNGEKCTGTFTKRIGNTTYRVNVHFAENTTDTDRKSTRLNSSHRSQSRMPSSA